MTTPGDKNCWRKIGVWGLESPRCELLELHLHCRNCADFRNAGREQYNREIELDYLKLRTEELAQPPKQVDKGRKESLMVFEAGARLALPCELFKEVMKSSPIYKVPHFKHPAFLGLVAHNGRLRLCCSLPVILGLDRQRESDFGFMVILEIQGELIVFPVSKLEGIRRYQASAIKPSLTSEREGLFSFSRGLLENNDVHLIDENKVLTSIKGALRPI